jgi:hypothetical protein
VQDAALAMGSRPLPAWSGLMNALVYANVHVRGGMLLRAGVGRSWPV